MGRAPEEVDGVPVIVPGHSLSGRLRTSATKAQKARAGAFGIAKKRKVCNHSYLLHCPKKKFGSYLTGSKNRNLPRSESCMTERRPRTVLVPRPVFTCWGQAGVEIERSNRRRKIGCGETHCRTPPRRTAGTRDSDSGWGKLLHNERSTIVDARGRGILLWGALPRFGGLGGDARRTAGLKPVGRKVTGSPCGGLSLGPITENGAVAAACDVEIILRVFVGWTHGRISAGRMLYKPGRICQLSSAVRDRASREFCPTCWPAAVPRCSSAPRCEFGSEGLPCIEPTAASWTNIGRSRRYR